MSIRNVSAAGSASERDARVPIKDPLSPGLIYRTDTGALEVYDPTTSLWRPVASAMTSVQQLYRRLTVAEVNTGATLLAAVAGIKYRMTSCRIIAKGGAATTGTSVDITGTQTTAKILVSFLQANLTQSAVVSAGGTGGTVLADGASFAVCDVNTAITIAKVGTDFTVVTGFDVFFDYVVVPA